MSEKSILDLAEGYGLSVEAAVIPENGKAFRIYKGANQVFIGTEDGVRDFLADYEKGRPDLYEGSMYGYKE
jgi:hypothetical protein